MQLEPREQMVLALKRAGVTQREIASEISINVSTVNNYLTGDRAMTDEFPALFWAGLKRLADIRAERIRAEADESARKLVESAQIGAPA